jgi:PglZ domain
MTDPLKTRLAGMLAATVDRHHLVVWQDDEAAYNDVVDAVVPAGTALAKFDKSWFELRRKIETQLALADPPKLVVYVNAGAPERDPLAEVRAAAHELVVPLRDLIRQALAEHLPASQIDAIANVASTFDEAEAAAGTGVAPGLVSLVPILGAGLTDVAMVVAVLGGTRDQVLDTKGAWGDVHRLIERTLGITTADTHDALRESVARVLLLDAIDRADVLPERLQTALPAADDTQRVARLRAIEEWWALHPERAGKAFAMADSGTALSDDTAWAAALTSIDIAPSLEKIAARQVLELSSAGRGDDAVSLAATRAAGRWPRLATVAPALDDGWAGRWRALLALAELRRELLRRVPPTHADSGAVLTWYASDGWRVDRTHRRLELALTGLGEHGELEQPVADARAAYEDWLTLVIERYTSAIATSGYGTAGILRQAEVFTRFVKNGGGPLAYVWVDAFRFELASDVAESLRAAGNEVELVPAIAAAPTITPVGMADLCPGAEQSFAIEEMSGSLVVRVAGVVVATVDDRRTLVRGALGDVADLELGKCVQLGEQALSKEIEGTKAVLVRSTEFDVHGEAGLLSAAWTGFADTQSTLPRVVAKLAKAGIRRVVITADHGFISLSRRLGDAYKIDAPKGGSGELHRRAWIGRGGVDHPSVLRVSLASTGVTSDLDILVPRSLALFKAGGSKQFFHGGLSPQELVIPVIVAQIAAPAETGALKVDVDVVGNSISTGMFAATVAFTGDLFTNSVVVRAIARRGKDLVVAQVINGDGFDASSGTVSVPATNEVRLMFQVTKRLDPNDKVEVQVLDARTDALLGKATVAVAAPVSTFDDDLED